MVDRLRADAQRSEHRQQRDRDEDRRAPVAGRESASQASSWIVLRQSVAHARGCRHRTFPRG